jgi:hypothetical protein
MPPVRVLSTTCSRLRAHPLPPASSRHSTLTVAVRSSTDRVDEKRGGRLSKFTVLTEDSMRTVSRLATTMALVIGSTPGALGQGPDAAGTTSPPPAISGGSAGAILSVALLAVIVIGLITVAKYVLARRKRIEEAALLQSQLSDLLVRETQLHRLRLRPTARVAGWRGAQLTVEVAGEVPTPEVRETVMRIVSAEAWRFRPDVITVDHLFIVPSMRDSVAARG